MFHFPLTSLNIILYFEARLGYQICPDLKASLWKAKVAKVAKVPQRYHKKDLIQCKVLGIGARYSKHFIWATNQGRHFFYPNQRGICSRKSCTWEKGKGGKGTSKIKVPKKDLIKMQSTWNRCKVLKTLHSSNLALNQCFSGYLC